METTIDGHLTLPRLLIKVAFDLHLSWEVKIYIKIKANILITNEN